MLIDDQGGILAGHGRIEAAKLLGLETVPTIRLSDMTEPQRRVYVLADNKLAENAGWDQELLALELQYLTELELDFDRHDHGLRGRRDRCPDREPGGAGPRCGRPGPRDRRDTADLPPRRPLAPRPKPPALRRCHPARALYAAHGRQDRADGLH